MKKILPIVIFALLTSFASEADADWGENFLERPREQIAITSEWESTIYGVLSRNSFDYHLGEGEDIGIEGFDILYTTLGLHNKNEAKTVAEELLWSAAKKGELIGRILIGDEGKDTDYSKLLLADATTPPEASWPARQREEIALGKRDEVSAKLENFSQINAALLQKCKADEFVENYCNELKLFVFSNSCLAIEIESEENLELKLVCPMPRNAYKSDTPLKIELVLLDENKELTENRDYFPSLHPELQEEYVANEHSFYLADVDRTLLEADSAYNDFNDHSIHYFLVVDQQTKKPTAFGVDLIDGLTKKQKSSISLKSDFENIKIKGAEVKKKLSFESLKGKTILKDFQGPDFVTIKKNNETPSEEPLTTNPEGDGDNKGIDPLEALNNYFKNDRDHDGVKNSEDNCPDTDNFHQSDIDGDGVGDACDPEINATFDQTAPPERSQGAGEGLDEKIIEAADLCSAAESTSYDLDGDRVPDSKDNCMSYCNTDQADRDEDGVGDACDLCPNGDVLDDENRLGCTNAGKPVPLSQSLPKKESSSGGCSLLPKEGPSLKTIFLEYGLFLAIFLSILLVRKSYKDEK